MPSWNNVKTTLCISKYFYLLNKLFHRGSEIYATNSLHPFHLAHPHGFTFYLGNAVKSPAGFAEFGSVTQSMVMPVHKGQDPQPHLGEGLRSNMGQDSRQPQSYHVNKAWQLVKVKVADEDKRI